MIKKSPTHRFSHLVLLLTTWFMAARTSASLALAAGDGIGKITKPDTGLGSQDVDSAAIPFVNNVLAFITGVAAIWFLITIVWSGIRIIQGAKSPEDFYKQMQRIMWAAIGLILVALAYVVAAWITNTLFGGTNILDNPIENIKKT